MQSLHRARSRLVGERTALINQLRAVLLERGIIVAQGRGRLAQYLSQALDGDEAAPLQLSSRIRLLIEDMRAQWRELDRRVAEFDGEFRRRPQRSSSKAAIDHSRYRSYQRDRAGGGRR